jgi:hypothetical protein
MRERREVKTRTGVETCRAETRRGRRTDCWFITKDLTKGSDLLEESQHRSPYLCPSCHSPEKR